MLLPACVIVAFFLLLPFILSFPMSLTNRRLIPRPVRFVGLDNYIDVLTTVFWRALFNVTYFAVLVVPIQCGFALAMALLINQADPGPQLFPRRAVPAGDHLDGGGLRDLGDAIPVPDRPAQPDRRRHDLRPRRAGRLAGDPRSAMPGDRAPVGVAGVRVRDAWSISPASRASRATSTRRPASTAPRPGSGSLRHLAGPAADQHLVLIITTIQAFKLFTQVNILTQGGPRNSTVTVVQYMYDVGFVGQKLGSPRPSLSSCSSSCSPSRWCSASS